MQVSWIDEAEVRALAALLQDAFPEARAKANTPATTPEELVQVGENFLAATREESQSQSPPPAPVAVAPQPEVQPQPVAEAPAKLRVAAITPAPDPVGTVENDATLPEVIHIHETLRAIRDRAQEAGLIAPPPAPASSPAPVQESSAPESAPVAESPWPQASTYQTPPDLPAIAQAVASITEPEPAPVASEKAEAPPTGGEATMAERLDTFTQWAEKLTRAEQIILMDDYGDLLWGNPETNDLILTAMLALNASSRSRGPDLQGSAAPAFLRSQLGAQRELYALPSPTRFGTVTLALINPTEVDQDTTTLLQEHLVRSIEG